jgi:hypothetical protein
MATDIKASADTQDESEHNRPPSTSDAEIYKTGYEACDHALMTSATPAISIIMPTTNTLATVAATTL